MSRYDKENLADKQFRARLLKQKIALQSGLPHLYGWKHYKWSRKYFESTNFYNFLCAANQIGKSTAQIRKCIHWATEPKIWPKLWKTKPRTFWYAYPTKDVSTIEFRSKWVPELLPAGQYKDHEQYGWVEEIRNRNIFAIHFKTGVSIYFKTYSQDVQYLQTGTVHAVFTDEELPEDLFDELNMRTQAVEGYFHMAFTATLAQEFWRLTMEEHGTQERFPDAFKTQVSMYDCLQYEDGSPGGWTEKRIDRVIASCKSDAEVQRRVWGRFVKDEGLRYPNFSRSKNVKEDHHVPTSWRIYCGVDIGGGGKGHPAAICFVAVNPDYTQGRVFKTWRGDGVTTTASDILTQFRIMKGNMMLMGQFFDWQAKDFGVIAQRLGEPFMPAEKSHDMGEQILNTLFKNEMLTLYDTPDNEKLMYELESLAHKHPKQSAKDDLIDSLRYACTKIPWDWSCLEEYKPEIRNKPPTEVEIRRSLFDTRNHREHREQIEFEMEEWNEMYGAS